MNTATETLDRPRIPLIAAILSFIMPGLGQMYCGRITRAVVLLFLDCLAGAAAMILLGMVMAGWGAWTGYALAATVIAYVIIWLYAVADARRLARNVVGYTLRDYNRWYIYLLLAIAQLPFGGSVAMVVREGVMRAFVMANEAMAPTLHKGDRMLVNELAYKVQPVCRGDIVAHVNPNKRHQTNVRRVVALPGDTVEMRDGMLVVNGAELRVEWLDPSPQRGESFRQLQCRETNDQVSYPILVSPRSATSPATAETAPATDFPLTTLPNGQCFVLSDNRADANDSRSYGPLPLGDITGRVELVYWPPWKSLKSLRPKGN